MKNRLSFGFSGMHSGHKTVEIIRRCEEAGFESIWISEDYFQQGGFSLAGACAVLTNKIKIGVGVINPFTRHPILSTMEAIAIDELSQGRFILGLGASNKYWIENQMGIPYLQPLTAIKESVQLMRGLLNSQQVTHKGKAFSTGTVTLDRKPYRKCLPIFLGVKSERSLVLAGQVADGVLLSVGSPVEYVRYAKNLIHQGALAAGRNPKDILIAAYLPIFVNANGSFARENMRTITAEFLGIHGEHPILLTAGITPAQIAPFREAYLSGLSCERLVTDSLVNKLMIAGTAEECLERLRDYLNAGLDMPILFESTGVDPLESIKMIKANLM